MLTVYYAPFDWPPRAADPVIQARLALMLGLSALTLLLWQISVESALWPARCSLINLLICLSAYLLLFTHVFSDFASGSHCHRRVKTCHQRGEN